MKPDAALSILRSLYCAELEIGDPRSKEDYIALFEGHEELIAAEFDRMSLDRDASDGDDSPGGLPRIENYRVERELGRGGQATVYLAEHIELNRQVALKILMGSESSTGASMARFHREAALCSKLDHPGICAIYESGIARGKPFIAMQFVDGESLAERINHSRRSHLPDEVLSFETETAVSEDPKSSGRKTGGDAIPDRDEIGEYTAIMVKVTRALHAAHEVGIVHRDIKPGNIMVRQDGEPIVLDFGLARDDLGQADISLTQPGDFFGTPAYMSPEQLSAHRIELDRRTDIFSCGVTLYECLTHKRPFDAATRPAIYQAIMTKEPPNARSINPSIPRDLWVVTQKALTKDRDERYATAEELADDLQRILDKEPIQARPAGIATRVTRFCQRNPALAALSTVLFLVLFFGGGYGVLQKRQLQQAEKTAEKNKTRQRISRQEARRLFKMLRVGAVSHIDIASMTDLAEHLKDLGDEGIEFMRAKFVSEDDRDRFLAAQLCKYFDNSALTGDLETLSMNDNPMLASLASHALMRSRDPAAIPALKRLVDNAPNEGVMINSIFGLAYKGVDEGFELAFAFLDDKSKSKAMRGALGGSMFVIRDDRTLPMIDTIIEKAVGTDAKQRSEEKILAMLDDVLEFLVALDTPAARERLEALAGDERFSVEARSRVRVALLGDDASVD